MFDRISNFYHANNPPSIKFLSMGKGKEKRKRERGKKEKSPPIDINRTEPIERAHL